MSNEADTIEIIVKAQFLGEFYDFQTWLDHVTKFSQKYGVTGQLFHQDCKGYKTSGYDLRNTRTENVYPVKTYLLISDPEVEKPHPFRSEILQ